MFNIFSQTHCPIRTTQCIINQNESTYWLLLKGSKLVLLANGSLCGKTNDWLHIVSVHYRLRCSIGFWNEQKVDKSRCLFLSQKTPLSWRKWFFDQNMTQILYQKSFITFSENKYGQNHGQCSEKVERGLSTGWFFVWWKYRPFQKKSSK